MTKWNKLQSDAALLTGPRIEQDIWSLSDDPRFPAVLALLDDARKVRLKQGCGPDAADHHGTIAHAMGAVDVLDEIELRLQTMIEPPPKEEEK